MTFNLWLTCASSAELDGGNLCLGVYGSHFTEYSNLRSKEGRLEVTNQNWAFWSTPVSLGSPLGSQHCLSAVYGINYQNVAKLLSSLTSTQDSLAKWACFILSWESCICGDISSVCGAWVVILYSFVNSCLGHCALSPCSSSCHRIIYNQLKEFGICPVLPLLPPVRDG